MCRRKCNYNDNNRVAHAHSQKRKSVGRLLLLVCGKEDKLFFGSERTKLLSSKIPLAHFSQKKEDTIGTWELLHNLKETFSLDRARIRPPDTAEKKQRTQNLR
jgi:hypothetical protein